MRNGASTRVRTCRAHAFSVSDFSANQWCLVDYILFIKANVDLNPSPNEVQATQYVSPDRLKQLFEDPSLKFTPWFKLICNSFMFEWWSHLNSGLEKYMNEEKIHRM